MPVAQLAQLTSAWRVHCKKHATILRRYQSTVAQQSPVDLVSIDDGTVDFACGVCQLLKMDLAMLHQLPKGTHGLQCLIVCNLGHPERMKIQETAWWAQMNRNNVF